MTEITQADRDAAARAWAEDNDEPLDCHICEQIRAGYGDNSLDVIRFARHRMEERAAIVAYFRHIAKCIRLDADEGLWYPLTECDVQDAIDQYDRCAEWIEEGEHLESQMPSNLIPKPDPLVDAMRDCGFMDDVILDLLIDGVEPTHENLVVAIAAYPQHRDALVAFFANLAVQTALKDEPAPSSCSVEQFANIGVSRVLVRRHEAPGQTSTDIDDTSGEVEIKSMPPRLSQLIRARGLTEDEVAVRVGLDAGLWVHGYSRSR